MPLKVSLGRQRSPLEAISPWQGYGEPHVLRIPQFWEDLGSSWIIIGLNSCSIVTVGDLGKFDTACSHPLSHQLTGISSHACGFTLLGSFHLGACCTCCTLRTLQRGWGTLATGLGPSGSENYWTESAGHIHPTGPCRSNCFGLGLCFGMWEVVFQHRVVTWQVSWKHLSL